MLGAQRQIPPNGSFQVFLIGFHSKAAEKSWFQKLWETETFYSLVYPALVKHEGFYKLGVSPALCASDLPALTRNIHRSTVHRKLFTLQIRLPLLTYHSQVRGVFVFLQATSGPHNTLTRGVRVSHRNNLKQTGPLVSEIYVDSWLACQLGEKEGG